MVAFYNQGDQEIYEGGQHYIPQEQYRLGKFSNTVAPMPMDGTQQVTQNFGIPYTGAFTNAGGGGGGGGLGGKFGNLDESNMKMFYDQNVWDGSSWVNKPVKGYWDPNLNTYKTYEGKNIKHAGLFTGDPKKGDIEGEDFQFPGITSAIANWMKKKAIAAKEKIGGAFTSGQASQADIDAANLAGAEEIGATGPQWQTSKGGQDQPGAGGQNVKSSSGDVYGGAAAGYNEAAEKSDYYADGGRIGFEEGGWSPGVGRDEQGYQSTHSSFEGGQGDGNNQSNTGGITQLVDTDLMRTDPNVEINYDFKKLPLYLQAKLHNKNLLTEDNINLDGQVGGSAGLVDYGINFTDEGVTGSNVGTGPFEAHIDPNKNIDLGYTGNIGGYDINARTNLQDAASLSASKNGWDIGLTHNPEGTNAMVNWSTQFGQPEQPVNALSYDDLIYGQNLRYGGLAGLL